MRVISPLGWGFESHTCNAMVKNEGGKNLVYLEDYSVLVIYVRFMRRLIEKREM
jgi:hypothetical protein